MSRKVGAKVNVTIRLDRALLRTARAVAAAQGRSFNALLADALASEVIQHKSFEAARRRAVARLRQGLDLQWTPARSSQEVHDR
jgi:hypothetical protein